MAAPTLEVSLGIIAWYLTSFGTLLLNKYLLGSVHIQPNTLAVVQMVSTAIYGALKTLNFRLVLRDLQEAWRTHGRASSERVNGDRDHDSLDLEDRPPASKVALTKRWRKSLLQMGLVGAMRFATVVLGLVSLKHIAASFTETIKASAPFFTVVIAYLMLGERTSLQVVASLVPVAGGLIMVSFTELSFEWIGFSAAVATNVIECVQNVFSKRLLARDYSPQQLQFYTSLTALVLQAPIFVWNAVDSPPTPSRGFSHGDLQLQGSRQPILSGGAPSFEPPTFVLDRSTLALLWIDGVLYHLQSVVAYVVMSHLSPVTVSVVNTLKRAILIWISVLVFGNQVTNMSKLGTLICLLGALCYNYLRQSVPVRQAPDK